MITILGPTATGKTQLAAHLAAQINGAVISADSRQIYTGMDIGTGKDLSDYTVNEKHIPYYLIDIRNPGYAYNIFEYQQDFEQAYKSIISQKNTPILCGGSGLYIESVLDAYPMLTVPVDPQFRKEASTQSDEELITLLASYTHLHNHTDTEDRERLLRALEIQKYQHLHADEIVSKKINSLIFGISFDRDIICERIHHRLIVRLNSGMIEEVAKLLEQGITPESLLYYGLEYRYVTLFLQKSLTYNQMVEKLNIAIRQFAKRQMTWFRRMEKKGFKINWIDGNLSLEDKLDYILNHIG